MIIHMLHTELHAALRTLWRSWSYTLLVTGLLAIGLSVNLAAFIVLKNLLHGPVSLIVPDRIVVAAQHNPELGDTQQTISPAGFLALARSAPSIRRIAAYLQSTMTDTTVGEPTRVAIAKVSPNFFSVLGVRPLLGEAWPEIDPTAPLDVASHGSVAVISHDFWSRRLGGRLDVLSSRLSLDDTWYVIGAVMPEDFHLPGVTDVWLPLSLPPASPADWGTFSLHALAHLDPRATLHSAQVEASAAARQHQTDVPFNKGMNFRLTPLRESLAGGASQAMTAVFAVTLVMLLILCTTFINLVVHRAIERQDEFVVHLALGGTKWAVRRRYLLEVLIVVWAAAAIAVGVGTWLARAGVSLASLERLVTRPSLDYWLVAYAFLLVTLCAGLVAIVSTAVVFRATGGQLASQGRLRTMSRGQRRWNAVFLAAQVSMAVIFIHGTSMVVRSYERLRSLDLRFDPAHVVVLDATLPSHRYASAQARALFVDNALGALKSVPGVEAAGASVRLPVVSGTGGIWFDTEQTQSLRGIRPEATFNPVAGDYFATMRIRVLAGRVVDAQDSAFSMPASVVNRAFAVRFLGGRDPVGQRLTLTPWPDVTRTVVGVVDDVPHGGFRAAGEPTIYIPYAQLPIPTLYFVVRSPHDQPEAVISAVRARIRSLDTHLALGTTNTMSDRLATLLRPFRLGMWLVSVFGGLALAFAAAGAYGITARQVAQERRSIGVRLALGANPRSVVGLMMVDRIRSVSCGALVGLVGATLATHWVRRSWSEMEATSGSHAAVALLVLAMAVCLATYIGARGAGVVDPANLLRGE